MLRRVESPPDRLSVPVARAAPKVPRAPRGTGWLCGGGLGVVMVLFVVPGLAGGTEPLPEAEPAPVEELGPPSGTGVQITAEGVAIHVPASRRSAEVVARWRLRAAPGPLALTVPASLRAVAFSLEGPAAERRPTDPGEPADHPGVEVVDVVALDEVLPPVAELRIDPASGQRYATAPGAPRTGRVAHQLTIVIPPSGEVILRARLGLSSGYDRGYARRTNFEQAHALQHRRDPFVYQFAVRGPAGPVRIDAESDTVASARIYDGVVHAAAATRRPLPLGLTLGIGPAVSSLPPGPAGSAGDPAPTQLVQGLVRASLEVVLPHRDALALALEAGSDLRGGHHGGGALVYQLYTPAWPYLPLGGHLDTGVSCDFWQSRGAGQGPPSDPSLRCGPRIGATVNVAFIGLAPSVDLFPLREPITGSAETRWAMHYRIAILGTVGL